MAIGCTHAYRESCLKYKRQLHGVGREEIPISALMEQQVPPSASYKEATSASCSSCPIKQKSSTQQTALVFTLCIQNTYSHIFQLSVVGSGLKFSAGVLLCSLHIPCLDFHQNGPMRRRDLQRFLLCFVSVRFQSILSIF